VLNDPRGFAWLRNAQKGGFIRTLVCELEGIPSTRLWLGIASQKQGKVIILGIQPKMASFVISISGEIKSSFNQLAFSLSVILNVAKNHKDILPCSLEVQV